MRFSKRSGIYATAILLGALTTTLALLHPRDTAWNVDRTPASAAGRQLPTEPCEDLYAQMENDHRPLWAKVVSGKEGLEQFKVLRVRSMADYGVGTRVEKLPNGAEIEITDFSSDNVEQFQNDVTLLLDYQDRFFDMNLKPFRKWLTQKYGDKIPVPDPYTFEHKFKAQNYTLDDYVDELFLIYLDETVKEPNWAAQQVEKYLKNQRLADGLDYTGRKIRKAFTWGKGFLAGAILFGPGVQIVNSFLSVPIDPILQVSNKISNQKMGGVAKAVQTFINGGTVDAEDAAQAQEAAQKITEVRKDLEKITNDLEAKRFDGLTPDEARKLWSQFESRYFDLVLRMNQTLQPNLGGGRGFFREALLDKPLMYAANIATHDTQLILHTEKLEGLLSQVASHGGKPTPEEEALLKMHRDRIEFAKRAIGADLAGWTIYKFIYPEINTPDEKQALGNSFSNITRYIGFQMFVDAYAEQMHEAMKALDRELVLLQKLVQTTEQAKKPSSTGSP